MRLGHNKEPQEQNKKAHKSLTKPLAALALTLTAASGSLVATEAGASTNHHSQDSAVLKTLTKDITKLDKGAAIDVTSTEVKLPGPINSASGNPIIFENGKGGTYYAAYTQEHEPNFHLSPEQTATTMAIVDLGSNYSTPLTEAHLDKVGTLVNENEVPVGYSTSGESTGK